MLQYNQIKAKYPDAIVLFRIGDFYEIFNEDAQIASKVLGLVVVENMENEDAKIDLAGFEAPLLENHIRTLVKAGHKVAVCDQIEDPKLSKNIVKRGVTDFYVDNTVSEIEALIEKANESFRTCSSCGNQTQAPYVFADGMHYACDEDCRDAIAEQEYKSTWDELSQEPNPNWDINDPNDNEFIDSQDFYYTELH